MSQGKTEQEIIKQAYRFNRPLPKSIVNAPDLDLGSELYYFAFQDLGSCRYFEGGEIPWTAIREYCAEYEMDEDQRSIMFQVIRKLDVWFLDRLDKQANRKTKNGKAAIGDKGQGRVPKGVPAGLGRR